jgi:hypothetical protein
MSELLTIIVAIITSGTLSAVITTLINRRNEKKVADSKALDSITSGAEKISDSALEQLEYLCGANESLRKQKEELEVALKAASVSYSNALADIARMEAEYQTARAGLEQKHELCLLQLEEMKQKYILVLEENRVLRIRIEELEKRVRTESSG